MAYKYDPLKYQKTFDNMFGAGEFDRGIAKARVTGTKIGEAKLEREMREIQRKLEEEKRKEEEEEEEEKKKKSKKASENDNLKRRIEASGGSTEKKQSAFGKAANLDPDNNLFFDALDLLNRPLNAVMNVGKREEEREKSKSAKDKYLEEMQSKPIWETGLKGKWDVIKDQAGAAWEGFTGEEKTTGKDVLEEAGMKKGLGRSAAGFGLDVALDPLNLVGGGIAKAVGKGAGALNKGLRKSDKIDTAMNAVGDVFSNKRIMNETLNPKVKSDALQKINDELHATRSTLVDKSIMDVTKAKRRAGKVSGKEVGEKMEAPLSRARQLDLTTAPNVLDSSKLTDIPFRSAFNESTNALSPLARNAGLETKTTMSSKIGDLPNPTDKEVKTWLKANDLPGGDKKGRVSQFNKNFYKAENEQALRASYKVETKITKALSSTTDIDKATKQIVKDPAIKRNINQAAQTLIDSNDTLREFATKNGITNIGEIEGYMAHFATKEAQKYLKDAGEDFTSTGAAKVGGDERVLGRRINENVKNANTLMKQKTGVEEFFTTDAFTATAGGQHRVINYIVAEMAKKKIIESGDLARPMRSGIKARKGYVSMEIDGKKYEMTEGAAKVIQNYDKVIKDTNLEKSIRAFDKTMNVWKKSALFSGGYHARNIVGNTFNMAISDMNMGTALTKQTASMKYLAQLKTARSGGKQLPKGFPSKVAKQYSEFVNTGLRATGVGADYADETAAKAISEVNYRKSKGILGKGTHEFRQAFKDGDGFLGTTGGLINAGFEQSRRLGDEADEIARFTLYRHLRDKGMGPEKATNRVKEVLFDYNDLTTVEREGFKRLAPFYTFTRKNFEFQVKNMLQNPAKYSHMSSLYNTLYDVSGQDEDLVPQYLKNGMALPIGNQSLNFNLPVGDMARASENPLGMMGDMLTPALKLPLELGNNRSFFNDAPISEYEGQKGDSGLNKKLEYGLFGAVPFARNAVAGETMRQEGADPLQSFLKGTGSLLTKEYDEENYQLQADYQENERLQGIRQQMEDEGEGVLTFKEMKEQGIPTNEEEDVDKVLFDSHNLSVDDQAYMKKLRTKMRRSGDENRQKYITIMQQQGFPQDLIDYVTN